VVAGPNGSGKTTTTELLLANEWGANSLYIMPQLLYRTVDGTLAKQYVTDIPEWAQILI
jgi:ABC-type molybdenum transport system ATPase subunit/photorepair protein PhrA